MGLLKILEAIAEAIGGVVKVNDPHESKDHPDHLLILMEEAESKEVLLWWLNFFEKYNQKK